MTQPAGRSASPREEGELEDGEISDDSVRPESPKPVRHRPSSRGAPHQYRARPSSRPLLPTPHIYRPKEQYRLPPRLPQPSSMGDLGSRPSFWERSHDTLGRFRSRGRGGRFWERDWVDRGVKPGGPRQSNCGWRDPSPRKLKGRSPPRKSAHAEDESFEELLLKYKQIKLELESINKNEKLVLKEEPAKEEVSVVESTAEPPAPVEDSVVEEVVPVIDEKPPVKAFQAFELKPLRQKLKPITEIKKPIILEESKSSESAEEEKAEQSTVCTKEPDETEQAVPSESNTTDVVEKPDVEEEQLSELHLRLLALQSASKKWHQKEQLVLKESKEKLSKGKMEPPKEVVKPEPQKEKSNTTTVLTRKANSTTNAAKQARRRQQTKAWKKLQQQKAEEKRKEEEDTRKQAEDEERRKREEEIRKIRDLSNQEEQYNRFMKLVGDSKTRRSKSFDAEQKRAEKQGLENSGGIYQYDNYEEVAMDTDSETNSPASHTASAASPVLDTVTGNSNAQSTRTPALTVKITPYSRSLTDGWGERYECM